VGDVTFVISLLLLLTLLGQSAPCGDSLPLSDEAALACAEPQLAAPYLRGLIAARKAYAAGGTLDALKPVTAAIDELDRLAGKPVPAEIAKNVLLASAAASQSEREQMALFLAHALRIELLQLAARQPGAPIVTAHEVAGDLWLRVHRYPEARQAYLDAFKLLGPKPRITLGLARTAARMKDQPTACAEYRTLNDSFGSRAMPAAEIVEARAFLATCR
jgi:hypothetical protein